MKPVQTVLRMLRMTRIRQQQLQRGVETEKQGPKVDGRTEFQGMLPKFDDPIRVDAKKLSQASHPRSTESTRARLTDPAIIKLLEEKDIDTQSLTQETKPNGAVIAYDPNGDLIAIKSTGEEPKFFLSGWVVRQRNVRVGFSCVINLRAEERTSSITDSPETRLMNGRAKFGGAFSTN